MSLSDPISDMLTRLRNGGMAQHTTVTMPRSKMKAALAEVLKTEGYITGFSTGEADGHPVLSIELKYHDEEHVLAGIKRVSRPSCRVYVGASPHPRHAPPPQALASPAP